MTKFLIDTFIGALLGIGAFLCLLVAGGFILVADQIFAPQIIKDFRATAMTADITPAQLTEPLEGLTPAGFERKLTASGFACTINAGTIKCGIDDDNFPCVDHFRVAASFANSRQTLNVRAEKESFCS